MNKVRFLLYLFVVALIILGLIQALTRQKQPKVSTQLCSATISWSTDKPSTSQVEYDTEIDHRYANISELDTNLVTFHKVTLNNLKPSTRYHYRVRSKDILENESVGQDYTFITSGSSVEHSPPQISDVEASKIVAAGSATPVQEEPLQKEKKVLKQQSASPGQLEQEAGQLTKREPPIEKTLIEKGGILLPKGEWQLEPSFTYAHISANRIAFLGFTIIPVLVVGEISSEEVKRDIFVSTLTSRYGLGDNLQWELKVPYRYQHDRVDVAATSETTRDLSGIGDVETGLYYQLLYEQGWIPDMIAGVSVKSRTGKEPYGRDIGLGTGHWAIKTNMVAVKSSDPAILFGSLGYTYNFERDDITDYGTVKPGDTFEYSLGAAFALNYQLALNFQLEQRITPKMEMNDESVPGSFTNVVNFKYGLTWSINKDFSCDISATHGLSEDSPDFVLGVRFPYTF